MNLAQLLSEKRVHLGLTLQEVGDAAGISKGHLHDLEKGKHANPGLYTITKLSVILGIPVSLMAAAVIESNEANSKGLK